MTGLSRFIAALFFLAAAPLAFAQAVRVDDSRTQVLGTELKLRWAEPEPRPGTAQLMTGNITVDVRLNVRAWKGRQVRIYKLLANPMNARVLVRWDSQGRLLPGQLREGGRTLVYAGLVSTDEIQDVLRLSVIADGTNLGNREVLDFGFELELEGQ